MKTLICIILLGSLSSACSEKSRLSEDTNPIDSTIKEELIDTSRTGIYVLMDTVLQLNCSKLDSNRLINSNKFLLAYNEIINYNPQTYIFKLKITAADRIIKEFPQGRYCALMLEETPIYVFEFRASTSSIACTRVKVTLKDSTVKPDEIKIKFLNPDYPGVDPRNDSRLLDRLKKDGKLIE